VNVTAEPAVAEQGTVRNFWSGSAEVGSPRLADRLQTALRRMPKAGDEFVGFRLVRELGRGAFGRVFLATQPELAGRPVALKVSADLVGESRSLAQLQHTNIVPVYSVHRDGYLQAVCMPYFGATTLADLLARCRARPTLPNTGEDLVNTLRDMAADTRPDSIWDSVRDGVKEPSAVSRGADARTDAVFAALAGMSYPAAVCWLVARVADGLGHAHERGILHRDVKPANVLLTDDGQPMLLDFGVAEDLKVKADATGGRVGGTIPYMAPEHLDEIRTDARLVDARSDLYSLGVVLYEMLTSRHPFRPPADDLLADLPLLIQERKAWVPDVCGGNPEVPADLEAIVRTCVAADPTRRYQSAAALRDDLERHLRNEPLKVAREPSGWSRLRKWRRRNPRAGAQAAVAVGVVTALGLSVGSIGVWRRAAEERAEHARRDEARGRELARSFAERELAEFQDQFRRGRYLLTGRRNEGSATAEGIAQVRAALDRYGAADDPDWRARPTVAALSDEEKRELGDTLSDACVLLARGHMQQADGDRPRLMVAARFNELAERLRSGPAPRAVLSQRAELYAKLGEKADADGYAKRAADTPLTTAEDHYLAASELAGLERYADAVPAYLKAVRLDPKHFWAHFGLGVAYANAGRPADARASYTAAVALRPEFAWTYFNRAMAAITLKMHAEAVQDLDAVIDREPDYAPAYWHRALALEGAGNLKAATRDADAVLATKDPGGLHARAYLIRARLKRATGDEDGAKADLEVGLKAEPVDETGWLVRAHARLDTDMPAALADIERAVKLNPRSVQALQNQAYVLERLGRDEACLGVIDRLIGLTGGQALYRGGRAVLLARLGRVDEAVKLARELVAKDAPPVALQQAAGVYALASRTHPEHKTEAVNLLTAAVYGGVTAKDLDEDKDLDPLRDDPEFRKLLETAKKR
jgi:serine/threonine protein kinase/tetratricopeptide (TPR) repeat protein